MFVTKTVYCSLDKLFLFSETANFKSTRSNNYKHISARNDPFLFLSLTLIYVPNNCLFYEWTYKTLTLTHIVDD